MDAVWAGLLVVVVIVALAAVVVWVLWFLGGGPGAPENHSPRHRRTPY